MLNLILWSIVLAAGLALEAEGILHHDSDGWHTATYYIRRWVPRAIVAAALVWLAHHFGVIL